VARLDKGECSEEEGVTMAKLEKSTKVADKTISCLQMLRGYSYMEENILYVLLETAVWDQ
jgi:hypothetical protein